MMTNCVIFRHFRRAMTTIRRYGTEASNILISKKSYNDFQCSISRIVNDVLVKNNDFRDKQNAEHIKKLIEYTVLGGRKLSAFLLINTYRKFENLNSITEESLNKSYVLGWCMEIYNSSFIIVDDMIDGERIRRGRNCWYLLPEVGSRAANDSLILMSFISQILKLNFSKEIYYADLVNQFNEAHIHQCMGQYLDSVSDFKRIDMKDFNIQRNNTIKECQLAYSFKLPFCLALLLSNKYKSEISDQISDICNHMAKLYGMQNDYLDCYGTPELTGKRHISTDIPGGKCTWLAVNALQRCSTEQRADFIKYYGSSDLEHVELIKRLYDDLRLPEIYREEEKMLFETITQKSKHFPKGISPEPILSLLDIIIAKDYFKFTNEKLVENV